MRKMKSCYAIVASLLLGVPVLLAQKPDRSAPPELGPPPSLKLPPIQRFLLSNGLPVVLMEKHGVPLVQVNMLIGTGAAMDPSGKSGLATMTADMLDEGAGTRNALELADAIDFLGASLTTGAGMHTSAVELFTPLSKLDEALPLMADVVQRPTFPADELERKRKQRLTTFVQWHDEPRAIASVLFNRVLFGTRHPYGLPTAGDEKTTRSLGVSDLKNFHATHFHAGNATLIVVGDVKRETVEPKLEAAFGAWEAKQNRPRGWGEDIQKPRQVAERRIYLVDRPGAAQSEIRIGRIGVERTTEDYYALLVMNTILGGSFTSRLNQNLRETHGYSYGAGSSFDMRPLPGPFVAASAVHTAVTDKALVEFMKELNAILEPVSDEELTRAKNYLALGYADNFQTIGRVARQLADLVVYNLPDDYFNRYVERVLAVTKEDVQRVAKKYLDPERVAVVVVGDRKATEKGIRELKLGPVNTLSVRDVLGAPPDVRVN